MTVAEDGGIFVSYRRQESSHLAGRLYDRLAGRFGEGQVFIDVDTIEPGVDFAEEIFRAVAACKVLLAIIGPGWVTAADERGRPRLEDPDDIVRLEIEAALARDVRVIPILVEGAVMPGRDDLPESLAGLARRNALTIRHESFRSDAARLVTAIERVLASGTAAIPAPHARNDLARAEAIFAEAERTARSMTNEWTRSLALSEVAEALAATDPDGAARLLADAQRAADSITDEISKSTRQERIAEALAATDPDRAERIARSLTHGHPQVLVLSKIAKTLAATDPDRAAGLLADAERIARSVAYEPSKSMALWEVAGALAATDPDRADRVARSITDEHWRVWALSKIAKTLAATDPDRATGLLADAERIIDSITGQDSRELALGRFVEGLAVIDPDRAERIARSITDEQAKTWALSSVAQALAARSL